MQTGKSISQIAQIHGLSRSTLLYYDRIGLLRASSRTGTGYRRYGPVEERRLDRICELRRTGMPLSDIQVMLGQVPEVRAGMIERRLAEIARQLVSLRHQQRLLTAMHRQVSRRNLPPLLDKTAWVEMLQLAGLDEEAMHRWHAEFERRAPGEHGQFLALLGIPAGEIAAIRKWSQGRPEQGAATAVPASEGRSPGR